MNMKDNDENENTTCKIKMPVEEGTTCNLWVEGMGEKEDHN